MLYKKYNKIVIAVLIILLCSISVGVLSAAPVSVSALVADYITFMFDGRSQPLPEGYTVLMHENRTYVPARFVAEQLNATVDWIPATNSVMVSSKPCDSCAALENKVKELETTIALKDQEIKELTITLEEKDEDKQPARTYEALPVTKRFQDFDLTITLVAEETSYTRVYVELENKQSIPLQLLHRRTTAIVDGTELKSMDVPTYLLDNRWFNNVNQDETTDGYIILPAIPENKSEMLLNITILYNDADQRTTDMEFAIKY